MNPAASNLSSGEILRRRIELLLGELNSRERLVLRSIFGIGSEKPIPIEKLCEIMRVYPEDIERIKTGALKKLRKR